MRENMAWIAFAVVGCGVIGSSALGADVTAALDLNSAYVWRGTTFNDGPVLQPWVDVVHDSGLGFNVWSNFDLDDYGGAVESGEFSEVDLLISYAVPVEQVDFTLGYVEYLFPATSPTNGTPGTRELFAEVGFDIVEGLTTIGFFAYDVDEVDDFYASLDLTYGYTVNEQLDLSVGGLLGFAGADMSAGGESGANEWEIRVGGEYALSDATTLAAFLAYTDALDDQVLPAGPGAQDVTFYGGLGVTYSF